MCAEASLFLASHPKLGSTHGTSRHQAYLGLRPHMDGSQLEEVESPTGTCRNGCQPLGLCDPVQANGPGLLQCMEAENST